ncbi:MAG: hypothetical protein IPN06_13400 [Burkholderiales bacterium]|nr:hypothetical protein [Burkholderiales bacterium]
MQTHHHIECPHHGQHLPGAFALAQGTHQKHTGIDHKQHIGTGQPHRDVHRLLQAKRQHRRHDGAPKQGGQHPAHPAHGRQLVPPRHALAKQAHAAKPAGKGHCHDATPQRPHHRRLRPRKVTHPQGPAQLPEPGSQVDTVTATGLGHGRVNLRVPQSQCRPTHQKTEDGHDHRHQHPAGVRRVEVRIDRAVGPHLQRRKPATAPPIGANAHLQDVVDPQKLLGNGHILRRLGVVVTIGLVHITKPRQHIAVEAHLGGGAHPV